MDQSKLTTMRNMSLDYFEFCTMLSNHRLDELKFYEVPVPRVSKNNREKLFASMYHVSDGKPRNKHSENQMNASTWHEKTFVFYPVGFCDNEKSTEGVVNFKSISKYIKQSKIDFAEYVYPGGSVISMNYKRVLSFKELPENIKKIVLKLFKQASHFRKNSNCKDFSMTTQ